MTLQASYQQFSLAIDDELSAALGSSLDDYYFGTTLLLGETDVSHAPGGGTQSAEDVVPGDATSTAAAVIGGSVSGSIDTSDDQDWYQVTLVAGKTYTFSTMFSEGIVDTVLRLRNASGNQILEENDDANVTNGYFLSEITFTATSSGTYFLDVSGFGSNTGGFFLTVTRPDADNIAGTAATNASLAIGATVSGDTNETGDHDWYAVQLVAGQTYVFSTEATGGNNDTDTTLYLRDTSGALLSFDDDISAGINTYSQLRFTPTATGTYYIDVGGWTESESGTYKLKAENVPPLTLYTYDQIAFQLTNEYWDGVPRRFNVQPGGTLTVNIENLTANGQFFAREALKLWSDVTGIIFSEVTGSSNGNPTVGDIRFNDNAPGAFSTSITSGAFISESAVNVSIDWIAGDGNNLRSYSFQTYLHEIGHALGLGHAGPYDGNASFNQDAVYLNDAWATTVMSYFDQEESTYFNGLGFDRANAVTPMIADIVAVASLYGAANNLRTGDTTYGFNNNTGRSIYDAAVGLPLVAVTVVDHGGTDTLNYSGFVSAQRLDLNAEAFSNVGGITGNLAIARGTVIENAIGGNGSDVLIGNGVANMLTGGLGNDSIDGNSNVDTAVVSGNRAAYTVTQPSTGTFTVTGPDGTDTLVDVEFLQFADQLLRLLPGTGTAVDFGADPDTYMAAIRDFDGNNLGAGDGWLRIGAADVDGDGDLDQILVNRTIGRFAEVATGPDGKVYFSDHGWAGETRVVGIYIDPEVVADPSKAGGPFDSQLRFQNDLLIENINGVLGGGDYDHDGLQEVYFRLTDGTAYLHAYMHADGNIRYANYQSQQQVIDFLTSEGWGPSTWAGWFPGSAEPAPKAAAVTEAFAPAAAELGHFGWPHELQAEMIYS